MARRNYGFETYSPETQAYLLHYNDNVAYYYWAGIGGILAIVSTFHWIGRLRGHLRRRQSGFRTARTLPKLEAESPGSEKKPQFAFRFVYPALAACYRRYSIKHSNIAEAVYLGNLSQLALIGVYLALNFLLIFLGANGDFDWFAHHAAKLTYANLPLVIGLAGKNNIISKCTGFAYESLNVLHRWSARFIIITSVIHIAGRIWVNVPSVAATVQGGRYIAWGWLAFGCFLYMIIAASRKIRNPFYQFFLLQHIFLWFIIVASLIIHRPQEQGWIWAGFALHLLDRIGRGCRIAYYHLLKTAEEVDHEPTAHVKVLDEDTMIVFVVTRQSWIPAQHVYLHVPSISPGGHPFTVCNIPRSIDDTSDKRPYQSTQELLIRKRNGMTRRVFEEATGSMDEETLVEGASPAQRAPYPIKAWTEGPYGKEQNLDKDFDTVLLNSGGSGVSYALSNGLDLVRRARAMRLKEASPATAIATKRLFFCYMIKRPQQMKWIEDHLKSMCDHAPPGFLTVIIHVTGKPSEDDPDVLPGYITHDKRKDEDKKAQEKRGDSNEKNPARHNTSEKPRLTADSDNGHAAEPRSTEEVDAFASSSTTAASTSSQPDQQNEKTGSMPTEDQTESTMQAEEQERQERADVGPYTADRLPVSHQSTVELWSGRPDFNIVVERCIAASDYSDWFAVGTCGPLPMNDSLADAVSLATRPVDVLRGEIRRGIALEIEEFGW